MSARPWHHPSCPARHGAGVCLCPDQLPTGIGVAIGKHTGPLTREDAPSLNLAARESWWEPLHRASVRCPHGRSEASRRDYPCLPGLPACRLPATLLELLAVPGGC